MGNSNMHAAKRNKNDEFYTRLEDIEKELNNYKTQLKDKIIYCNCDTLESNFWVYFYNNYHELELKGLIASHIDYGEGAYSYKYDGDKVSKTPIETGDFRSGECIELLKQADIVVTNPPFSLFREYIAQLVEYDKQFLIIGNNNAITYKEIFPLLKDEKMWLGYHANKTKEFALHTDYEKWDRVDENGIKYGKVPAISWFTNLDVKRRKEPIKLYHSYYGNEDKYPKYDNYDAINIDRVNSIPKDYEGIMGVPITFLTKHSPVQFEVLDLAKRGCDFMQMRTKYYTKDEYVNASDLNAAPTLFNDDKTLRNTYARILIRNKNPEDETNKKG